MRIVGAGDRGEVVLEDGLLVRFRHEDHVLAITLDEIRRDIQTIGRLVQVMVNPGDQDLVLDALAPAVLGLGPRLRPRGVLPADTVGLGRREIPGPCLRQQVRDESDTFAESLHIEIVDVISEGDVAIPDLIVNRQFVRGETIEVGLQEHGMVEVIERDEIGPRAT